MLEKLKQRWGVTGINLVLIICTFALGGSMCGYAGRKMLVLTGLEKGVLWVVLYIILISLLWPVCVLLISVPLGQFSFFIKYLSKVWSRMTGQKKTLEQAVLNDRPEQLAIFASGAGSNAQQIIDHFRHSASVKVALIVCNKEGAGVTSIAAKENIPVLMIERKRFAEGDGYLPELQKKEIGFIVLAGFLWKIPASIINAYPEKIVNIHPALLPGYGGKGMYGSRVHEAVIAAGEKQSGISIHFADELYDHGKIIFQATCPVETTDTAETLAAKIHRLEHQHYPRVIADILQNKNPR